VKEVIEEKVVGPSQEELAATRDVGKAAMQDRNEQARKAREAAKAIKKERGLAESAQKVISGRVVAQPFPQRAARSAQRGRLQPSNHDNQRQAGRQAGAETEV
jgi:hypothetical protein